jgi:hypothetical protein
MNRKHLRLFLSVLWCTAAWAFPGASVAEPSASPWMSVSPVGQCDPDESRGCTYNLPAGYQFTRECSTPGFGLDNGDVTPVSFRARPSASTNEWVGYNIRASKGGACVTIQLVLLPKAAGEVVGPNLAQARIAALDQILRTTAPPTASSVAASAPSGDSLPRWYFVSTQSKNIPIAVTLPVIGTQQQYVCVRGKPAATFGFGAGVSSITTFVFATDDTTACPDGKPNTTLVRLDYDALALTSADRAHAFNVSYLEAREPPDEQVAVALRLGGIFVTNAELRSRTSLATTAGGQGEWMAAECDGTTCPFVIKRSGPWTHRERMVEVRLDSPGARLLASTTDVFRESGARVELAEALLGTVKTWDLLSSSIPVPVGMNPRGTSISIPDVAARLLDESQPLHCDSGAVCATFHRSSPNAGHLVLEKDAVKLLTEPSKSLRIKLSNDRVKIIRKDADRKDTDVFLTLKTADCRYSFHQLTGTVSGIHEGQVLYWVRAEPPSCLSVAHLWVKPNGNGDKALTIERPSDWVGKETALDGAVGRVLSVPIELLSDSNVPKKIRLVARTREATDAADVELLDGTHSFELRVERSVDSAAARVDVRLDRDLVLRNQPHIAVGRLNELWIPRTFKKPWRIRLLSRGTQVRRNPPSEPAGARLLVSSEEDVLASSTFDGSSTHFLEGVNASGDDFAAQAELTGRVEDFLLDGATVPSNLRSRAIVVGSTNVTFSKRKTRVYFTPFDLHAKAQLECKNLDSDSYYRTVRASDPPLALKRSEYRKCRLRILLDDPADKTKPGPAQATLGQEEVKARWGRQQVKVTLVKGDESIEQLVAVRDDRHVYCLPNASKCESLAVGLGDVLETMGRPPDYTTFRLHVTYPANDALSEPLKDAYVPEDYQSNRASELWVRTLLMPDAAFRIRDSPGASTIGVRYYITAAGGISLVRTRDKGFGVAKSSDYDRTVQAAFDYGALFVLEPWNFSTNAAWIPVLAPQFTIGVLGPKSFNNREWWQALSGVVGFSFRLPAENKPAPGQVEAQTGLVVWYEITAGARDSVIHSVLFGLNVKVGALSP